MAKKQTASIAAQALTTYDEIISSVKDLERKGAAMPYTSVNGHMFSFLAADGTMALRLPKDEIEKFLKKHKTNLCEAHGAVLKEYVSVPAKLFSDAKQMQAYFKTSFEYVSSLKPKATKKAAPAAKKAPAKKALPPGPGGRNPKVDEFLAKKKHPLNAEIQRVREIVLGTSDKIGEDIKWSSPTFVYKGNIASYFLNAKQHVSLMFHYGASLPNKSGLLEGDGATGRVAKFTDMKDIEKKKKALVSVVNEYIKFIDAE